MFKNFLRRFANANFFSPMSGVAYIPDMKRNNEFIYYSSSPTIDLGNLKMTQNNVFWQWPFKFLQFLHHDIPCPILILALTNMSVKHKELVVFTFPNPHLCTMVSSRYAPHFLVVMQFLGDVAAHIVLSTLMMALVLGAFPPAVAPAVEMLVLLLFISDEVRTCYFFLQCNFQRKNREKEACIFEMFQIYTLNSLIASND